MQQIITVEQVIIETAEQGYEVIARQGDQVVIGRRSFDSWHGAPTVRFRFISPATIAEKIAHDERYATLSNERAYHSEYRIGSVQLEREWNGNDYGPFTAVSFGRSISFGDQSVTDVMRDLELVQLVLAFIADLEAEWADHDGTLTAEQQLIVARGKSITDQTRAQYRRDIANVARAARPSFATV